MSAPGIAACPTASRVIRTLAQRQRCVAVARAAYVFFLALAGAYAAALLASRLLGVIPDYFDPATLLAVPGGALVLGIVFHRRPTTHGVARLLDERTRANDLFLTATLVGTAAGDFTSIVLDQAEERAAKVSPARVLPFGWSPRMFHAAGALAALLAGILWLPRLDPFGREKGRQQAAQQRRLLAESQKATKLRLALLKKSNPNAKISDETKRAIDDLKKTFNTMKPTDKRGNFKRLTEVQKDLGTLWRHRSEKQLEKAFSRSSESQRFGSGKGQKAERWKRRLKRGDASEIKKEIQDIQKKAAQLQKTADPAERRKLERQMQSQLSDLADFLADNASSKSLQDSVQRALEQLSMCKKGKLSKEAIQALQQSLDLAKLESDAVAQAIRDLQSLEGGLRTAQLAKQLNELKALDGKGCGGCKDVGDYEDFYRKLMGGACEGEGKKIGQGMGKKGTGKGGEAPEKPEEQTDFKSERSRSAYTSGKILLQWKTHGLSEAGTIRENYQRQVETVKEGVGEAILQEQVPPGYHDAIKKYFDSLKEAQDGKPAGGE